MGNEDERGGCTDLIRSLITQYTNDMLLLDGEIDRLNTQYEHLNGTTIFFYQMEGD